MTEPHGFKASLYCAGKGSELYLKSEADCYIAHLKYKRCLAMANVCMCKCKYWHIRYTTASGYDRSYEKWKHKLFNIWLRRWLQLADMFKEANT